MEADDEATGGEAGCGANPVERAAPGGDVRRGRGDGRRGRGRCGGLLRGHGDGRKSVGAHRDERGDGGGSRRRM